MTPEAMLSGSVDRKRLMLLRVTDSRPMAVFTLDGRMARCADFQDLGFVTPDAVFAASILDRKILPILNITQAVIIVGEAFPMHSKVIWYYEGSDKQEEKCQADR